MAKKRRKQAASWPRQTVHYPARQRQQLIPEEDQLIRGVEQLFRKLFGFGHDVQIVKPERGRLKVRYQSSKLPLPVVAWCDGDDIVLEFVYPPGARIRPIVFDDSWGLMDARQQYEDWAAAESAARISAAA